MLLRTGVLPLLAFVGIARTQCSLEATLSLPSSEEAGELYDIIMTVRSLFLDFKIHSFVVVFIFFLVHCL